MQSRPVEDASYTNILSAVYMLYRGEPISISDIRHIAELTGEWDELRFVTLIKVAEHELLVENVSNEKAK